MLRVESINDTVNDTEAALDKTVLALYQSALTSDKCQSSPMLDNKKYEACDRYLQIEKGYQCFVDSNESLPSAALLAVARFGHTPTVERFIKENENKKNRQLIRLYTEALWLSMNQRPQHEHHERIFWLLLDAGADVNMSLYRDGYESHALIWAIKQQDSNKILAVLDRGASKEQGNPLWHAAAGDSIFVHLLIKKGMTDPLLMAKALSGAALANRYHAIFILIEALRLERSKHVISPDTIHLVNINMINAFLMAAKVGSCHSLRAFDECGMDLNAMNHKKESALGLAAYFGQTKAVQWLLERGADVNAADVNGRSVLMNAIISNNADLVSLLLKERELNRDHQDAYGDTAEMLAHKFDREDMVKLIQAFNPDEIPILSGETAEAAFVRSRSGFFSFSQGETASIGRRVFQPR